MATLRLCWRSTDWTLIAQCAIQTQHKITAFSPRTGSQRLKLSGHRQSNGASWGNDETFLSMQEVVGITSFACFPCPDWHIYIQVSQLDSLHSPEREQVMSMWEGILPYGSNLRKAQRVSAAGTASFSPPQAQMFSISHNTVHVVKSM